MLFTLIEGEKAIIMNNGVYRQCDLYQRNGQLFAKWGTGYIRLSVNGSTSTPKARLETLVMDGELHADQFGRLLTRPGEKSKPVYLPSTGVPQLEEKSK